MVYTFDKANANAPSKRDTQYFEMVGNRAHLSRRLDRRDDAARSRPGCWATGKLPDLERATSGSSTTSPKIIPRFDDLAAKMPDKLKEMQALFMTEAAQVQRLPAGQHRFRPAPDAAAERERRARPSSPIPAKIPAFPSAMRRASWTSDYTITAEITVPEGGAEGMIVTLGGRFGGYGLYLLNGKPVFDYNFLDLKQFRWEGGVAGEDLFGRRSSRASTRSCSTSNTTARPRQGRHGRALGRRQGILAAKRSSTRFRC